jgi:L-fuculose-phosphate aldolase
MTQPDTDQDGVAEQVLGYARRLVDLGQLPWFGGNNSVRMGDQLLITRTSLLGGREGNRQTVVTGIFEDDDATPWASSALPIHRAIYRTTSAKAIVHAHPYHATLLTFFRDSIEPIDENGLIYLGSRVAVIAAPKRNAWNLVADELAAGIGEAGVVMLRWHGSFAAGDTLDQAMHKARAVEDAARFIIDVPRLEQWMGSPTMPPAEAAREIGGDGTRVILPGRR